MPKPQFIRYILPLLHCLQQQPDYAGTPRDITTQIIKNLSISEQEQQATLKSGQRRVHNQIAWARFYLAKGGLLDTSERGVWRLTVAGQQAQLDETAVQHLFTTVQQQCRRETNEWQLEQQVANLVLELQPHEAHEVLSPNYWLFAIPPSIPELKPQIGKIAEDETADWAVYSHQDDIRCGDKVVFWQIGIFSGVYALGEVCSEVFKRDSGWAVRVHYTQVLTTLLRASQLAKNPVWQDLTASSTSHRTVFKISDLQWQALQTLLSDLSMFPPYQTPSWTHIQQTLAQSKLRFTTQLLRRYHLSLHTRRFVILAGISGTGKTALAETYAQAVGAAWLLVPVAPNWMSHEDLLGFTNPFNQTYQHTPFSQFLHQAAAHYTANPQQPRPYHVILDEMNLARVEHYFAPFLSALETQARGQTAYIDLDTSLCLPPNLYVIGTVNMDETTHGFADKVYDRAQLIELQPDREALQQHLAGKPYQAVLMEIWDAVQPVAPFAFRVVDDIVMYIEAAAKLERDWQEALDEQLVQKILPKISGSDIRLGEVLMQLEAIIQTQKLTLSAAKLAAMRHQFNQYGMVSYFS